MKKTLITLVMVILMVAIAASAFAGGKKEEKDKQLVIGRIFFDLTHPYQQADAKHYEMYGEELGIKTITIDGKASMDVMTNSVDDLIAKNVDGIIVQPLDGAAIAGAVKASQAAGIPIVVFFENVKGATAPYVRINEHDVAVEMGEITARKFQEIWPGKEIKIGVVGLPRIEYVLEHRTNAFVSGVQNVAPDAEVVAHLDGGGARDKSLAVAEDMLQSNPEVNIIYGINDDSSLGALAAFQAAGRGKAKNGIPETEIFVGTGGSTLECLEVVDPNSPLKITMALSPRDDAYTLTDTLLKIINGELAIDEEYMIDTYDIIINGWTDDIADVQAFVSDEYFAEVDLKEEISK